MAALSACGDKKSTDPGGTPPGAPTIGTATAGNGSATVTFTPPADTGTAAITQYTASCSATGAATKTASAAASPITVTGLTNGTTYTCTVTATSADGNSSASGGVQVTPTSGPTAPGPPTIGTATRGNASASIAFSAPASDGGSTITGYTATCTATGQTTRTGTNPTSPVAVTNLTNGTQYSCNVFATNAIGNGAASSNVSVTPATVPSAPTIGTATPGNGSASIAFTVSANNGGAAITGYTATCSATSQTTRTGTNTTTPISVTSLLGGVEYSCNVFATNNVGNSVASSDVKVTPTGTPGPPTIDSITTDASSASVYYKAPTSNGGSAITSYTATCSASGQTTRTTTGTANPMVVTNMTTAAVYLCNMKATNANGTGAASADVSATPKGVPGVPTMGTATAGDGFISVSFTAPASNGGSAITKYTATCTPSGGAPVAKDSTTSPIVVTGLTNGTTYGCSVSATNAVGTGAASGTASTTPRPLPGAPTSLAATAGNGSASFTFTAPSNSVVAAVTSYTVTCTFTTVTRTGSASASPVTVSNLTNGTQYACTVTATGAVGTGPASSSVNVTPVSPPSTSSVWCPYSYSQQNTVLLLMSTVSWTCSTNRSMTSTQVPDYPAASKYTGNPNAIAVQNDPAVTFTLTPSLSGSTYSNNVHIIGWAKNGVKFDPATAETCPTQSYCTNGGATYGGGTTWNVEAIGQTLFSAGVDNANAHVQPNGAYHYHGMPNKYLKWISSNGADTTSTPAVQYYLIGFALDGFPIYAKYGYSSANDNTSAIREIVSSYQLKTTIPTGRPDTSIVKYGTFTQDWQYVAGSGDLDECNGRTGKTPEFPNGTYHYFVTNSYPYIQRCFKGVYP